MSNKTQCPMSLINLVIKQCERFLQSFPLDCKVKAKSSSLVTWCIFLFLGLLVSSSFVLQTLAKCSTFLHFIQVASLAVRLPLTASSFLQRSCDRHLSINWSRTCSSLDVLKSQFSLSWNNVVTNGSVVSDSSCFAWRNWCVVQMEC